jgi:hypothetical protein
MGWRELYVNRVIPRLIHLDLKEGKRGRGIGGESEEFVGCVGWMEEIYKRQRDREEEKGAGEESRTSEQAIRGPENGFKQRDQSTGSII